MKLKNGFLNLNKTFFWVHLSFVKLKLFDKSKQFLVNFLNYYYYYSIICLNTLIKVYFIILIFFRAIKYFESIGSSFGEKILIEFLWFAEVNRASLIK